MLFVDGLPTAPSKSESSEEVYAALERFLNPAYKQDNAFTSAPKLRFSNLNSFSNSVRLV